MSRTKQFDLISFILDTVFPRRCLGCKTFDTWLCEKCQKTITPNTDQVCPLCQKKTTPLGKLCFACKSLSDLDGLFVCFSYKNKMISQLIHAYKYSNAKELSGQISQLMIKASYQGEIPIPECILPVPLHKKRLRWRGYNQSELLAKNFAKSMVSNLELPLHTDVLIRIKNTRSQMKLKKQSERKENISNAFLVLNSHKIKGKSILLIDDVSTTGSTLFECAKELKRNGAKEVQGVVIARQQFQSPCI